MKIKRRNSRTAIRVATLFLGLGLAGAGIASAINQVMAEIYMIDWSSATYPYEKETWTVTDGQMNEATGHYFAPEYSKGMVYVKNTNFKAYPHPKDTKDTCKKAKSEKVRTGNYFCRTNTEKQDGSGGSPVTYVEFDNGAIYENQWIDVIEYDWIDKQGMYARNLDNGGITSDEVNLSLNTKNNIHRELHFYKHKAGDGVGAELSEFKGIISFSDFDFGEGYAIAKRNLVRAFPRANNKNKTPIVHPDEKTWIMSGRKKEDVPNGYGVGEDDLWVEVKSTPDKPLLLNYKNPKFERGSKSLMGTKTVTYNLSGDIPADLNYRKWDTVAAYDKKDDSYKMYSVLKMNNTPTTADSNYSFSGWFTDKDMTHEYTSTTMTVTASTTLYGRMKNNATPTEHTASVTTSIENGVITASETGINTGGNYMVSYTCNNGSSPDSVTVDGAPLTGEVLVDSQSSYTFTGITEDEHTVAVHCPDEAATDPDDDDDDDDDEDITQGIVTSIENGTITDSIVDYVDASENYDIEYSCNEGFHLASILVDGEEVDINEFPTTYSFENVTSKRTIDVVCTDVNAPNTGSINSSNYDSGNTTGGSINVVAILISSLVSIAGFALVIRFVKHNSAISFKK